MGGAGEGLENVGVGKGVGWVPFIMRFLRVDMTDSFFDDGLGDSLKLLSFNKGEFKSMCPWLLALTSLPLFTLLTSISIPFLFVLFPSTISKYFLARLIAF